MRKFAKSTKLPAAARRLAIRERIADSSSVSVAEMAKQLGVSEMTIRRDLEQMAETTDLRRTHGGAVIAERMIFEFNYQERQWGNIARKKAIARAAREQISAGQKIILDTGTTTLELARLLKDCAKATVITPSLAVASELQFCEDLTVILLGGMIHKGSPDLTGPLTEHCLDLFSADWVFQGAEAISEDGVVFNVDLQLAQVDRKMRKHAARRCLLADSSKIGGAALVKTGVLSDFDLFITDKSAPAAFLRTARRQVPQVLTA